MPHLVLSRIRHNGSAVIGKLYFVGADGNEVLCTTLEREDTRIPTNKLPYVLCHDVVSPKYGDMDFYQRTCKGCLPRILVPERYGILIHCGNYWNDSKGCILVGEQDNEDLWTIKSSRRTFERIISKIRQCNCIRVIGY